MPDGSRGDLEGPAGVVLLSAEDDASDTVRPRLDVAGGDPARVAVLEAVDDVEVTEDGGERRRERAVTLADIEPLRQAIQATGARLVVIDPLMAYTGGTDTHRDAEVRGLLRPLAELAAETGCAIVVVRHLNKSAGGNPLYRGGGSIGIIGAARSGLLVAPDPDDAMGQRKVLAPTKSNLSEPPPALTYTIEVVLHEAAGFVPRIHWHGESPHTARSLLAQPVEDGERSALEEAKAFLLDLLGAGPVEADRVRREARAAGIADVTLRRAKALLGVQSERTGGLGEAGRWTWRLPPRTRPRSGLESEAEAAEAAPALRCSSSPKMLMPEGMSILGRHEHLRAAVPELDGAAAAGGLPEDGEARPAPGLGIVQSNGPCPRCGYQLAVLTCWRCKDSLCLDCGQWTGSGLRTRCVPCGIKADQRERWGDRPMGRRPAPAPDPNLDPEEHHDGDVDDAHASAP
jgi:hypothetical protein